jgi:hypothetical protein
MGCGGRGVLWTKIYCERCVELGPEVSKTCKGGSGSGTGVVTGRALVVVPFECLLLSMDADTEEEEGWGSRAIVTGTP